jgi:probable F420-dependent oxidoreductase
MFADYPLRRPPTALVVTANTTGSVRGMLRFGVSAWSTDSGDEWRDSAQRYEQLGYDTLWVADHVGMLDPFTALVAAGAATQTIRLGTYVLNVEFWNPLLLARTAATVDLVTGGGRLVLGLGAGHAQVEFEQAGLPYPPPGERVDRLRHTVPAVRRLLAGETVDEPALGLAGAATGLVPAHPPILVGGNGDQVLTVAATEADVVGLVGFTSGTGQVHTDLSHWSWDGLAERLGHVRAAADGRTPTLDLLVQRVAVTDDRKGALADFLEAGMGEEQLDSPFLLVGDEQALVDHLARLEGMGIHGVTVFGRNDEAEALAPVIARLTAGG